MVLKKCGITQPYTRKVYKGQEISRQSAQEIVPLVLELLNPESVVDVGCGIGVWLAVFKEYGIEDILGIDSVHVDERMLQIPVEKFLTADLEKPLCIGRQFGLVVSLEVAEHLPIKSARGFVKSLVNLGHVVLFSAAVPFQGGTRHLNEQWPDYWKQHFEEQGYVVIDVLRKRIWQNDKVKVYYRQNILLFVREDFLIENAVLKKEYERTNLKQLSIIHPELYLNHSISFSLRPLRQRFARICKTFLAILFIIHYSISSSLMCS